MKRCSKCGEEKPLEDFALRTDSGRRRGVCRACVRRGERLAERARRKNNLDKCRANDRAKYRRNRAAAQARQRRYRARYPDKIAARSAARYRDNPEQAAVWRDTWRAANPEKYRAHQRPAASRYRGLKANAPQGDSVDAAAFAEMLRQGICELCGAHGPIHVDHIEALSTGGEHGWENFAGLCPSCNSGKHNASLLTHLLR